MLEESSCPCGMAVAMTGQIDRDNGAGGAKRGSKRGAIPGTLFGRERGPTAAGVDRLRVGELQTTAIQPVYVVENRS